jgi:hypothetical protein
VAVGNDETGPKPQMRLPDLAGVKKSCSKHPLRLVFKKLLSARPPTR